MYCALTILTYWKMMHSCESNTIEKNAMWDFVCMLKLYMYIWSSLDFRLIPLLQSVQTNWSTSVIWQATTQSFVHWRFWIFATICVNSVAFLSENFKILQSAVFKIRGFKSLILNFCWDVYFSDRLSCYFKKLEPSPNKGIVEFCL